jgi:hypothetical protein
MTVYTSRFGFQWNYQAHDAGWGNDFNYTMRALAVLLDCYLTSDTVTTPPGSPAENDAYYVPATATGVWSTNTGKIAAFQGGAWQYYTPERGTRAYIASRTGFYWFNGTLWLAEATSGAGGGGVLTVAGHSPDISGNVSLVVGDITGAAPLSSPALTGTPTTPNVTALSRSTQIANTKYVDDAVTAVVIAGAPVTSVAGRTGTITLTHSDLTDWTSATSTFLTSSALSGYATTSSVTTSISTAIAALVNSAPGTMDTLGEIATLLAADESTASALATTVAGKVSKSGDTMTGALHLVAPGGSDNSDIAVSSAWVQTYVASLGFGTGSGTITGVTAGTGLTGGGTSGAVTLAVAYGTASNTAAQGNDSRITGALQSASNLSDVGSASTARTNLGLGTAAVAASTAFKAAGAVETWATLPVEAQNLPLPVAISGKPTASQTINVVMAMAVTIPANFAGTVSYQGTQATASVAVTVNKISGGSTTAIGTITLGTASKTAITLSTQAQVTFAAGDVLQFVWPTQDATLSDVGITVLGAKV